MKVILNDPPIKLGHRRELDGVRGIAILLVFFHHIGSYPPGGFLGVDLFFVLSGFLITTLLLQEWNSSRNIRLKAFYMRRVLRLVPALLVLVLVISGVNWAGGPSCLHMGRQLWLTLAYCLNLAVASGHAGIGSPVGITWSLSIEEQFYLIWPITLLFLLRRGTQRRALCYMLVLLVALGLLQRLSIIAQWFLQTDATTRFPSGRLYYGTDTRAEGLLLGCLTAFALTWARIPPRRRLPLQVAGLILLIVTAFSIHLCHNRGPWFYAVLLPSVNVAFALGIYNLVRWPDQVSLKVLRFGPLCWFGQISYSLYLWHWTFVLLSVEYHLEGWRRWFFSTALSLLAASVSYYVIERRFVKLKKLI